MLIENIEIIEEIDISIEEEVIENMANVLTSTGLEISLFGDGRNGRQMKICSKSETISGLFQLGKLVATLENVPLKICEAKNKERQKEILNKSKIIPESMKLNEIYEYIKISKWIRLISEGFSYVEVSWDKGLTWVPEYMETDINKRLIPKGIIKLKTPEIKTFKSPEQQEIDNENFLFVFPYRIEFNEKEYKRIFIEENKKGIVGIYESSEVVSKFNVKDFKYYISENKIKIIEQ